MAVAEPTLTLVPELLTDEQAAAIWQIGTSKFHELRSSKPKWFPVPIQLSARVVRYSRAEVEGAVALMPRQLAPVEPASLKKARQQKALEHASKPSNWRD
jgi:predicted DNA-binding transcriptional regulator AlpA